MSCGEGVAGLDVEGMVWGCEGVDLFGVGGGGAIVVLVMTVLVEVLLRLGCGREMVGGGEEDGDR